MTTSVFNISKEEQYRTVGELIEKARPGEIFYTLIILSSIIIAGGILTNNIPIIIGGMLVTPLLTPILVVALTLATGKRDIFLQTLVFLIKTVVSVILGSFVLGIFFGADVRVPDLTFTPLAVFLYFIIAFASGIAVTYAWVRKEASEILPGIAIVVSLVPPLSWVGIGLARGFFDPVFFSYSLKTLIIFLLNFIGIVLGSILVFKISKFDRVEKAIEKKHEKIKQEEKREHEKGQSFVAVKEEIRNEKQENMAGKKNMDK